MTAGPPRVGVDIGGTKCLGVVVDPRGGVLQQLRRPTPRGAAALIDTVVGLVGDLEQHVVPAGPSAVGVGVAGLVSREGAVLASPNVPAVVDVPLADLLGARLDRPVHVDNDANCALIAEWAAGAARGMHEAVMVTIGTGIGGGILTGGRVVRGSHGFAGEIGHMVVDPSGPRCPCGRRGCWERFASGSGLAHLARTAAGAGRLDAVVELAGGVDAIRGEDVQRAARHGDDQALAVVDEFARWVAVGLVNLTNALDPQMFVLGGGLAEGADVYLAPIQRWFVELLYSSDRRPQPELRFAELGERAGAIGAALLDNADPR